MSTLQEPAQETQASPREDPSGDDLEEESESSLRQHLNESEPSETQDRVQEESVQQNPQRNKPSPAPSDISSTSESRLSVLKKEGQESDELFFEDVASSDFSNGSYSAEEAKNKNVAPSSDCEETSEQASATEGGRVETPSAASESSLNDDCPQQQQLLHPYLQEHYLAELALAEEAERKREEQVLDEIKHKELENPGRLHPVLQEHYLALEDGQHRQFSLASSTSEADHPESLLDGYRLDVALERMRNQKTKEISCYSFLPQERSSGAMKKSKNRGWLGRHIKGAPPKRQDNKPKKLKWFSSARKNVKVPETYPKEPSLVAFESQPNVQQRLLDAHLEKKEIDWVIQASSTLEVSPKVEGFLKPQGTALTSIQQQRSKSLSYYPVTTYNPGQGWETIVTDCFPQAGKKKEGKEQQQQQQQQEENDGDSYSEGSSTIEPPPIPDQIAQSSKPPMKEDDISELGEGSIYYVDDAEWEALEKPVNEGGTDSGIRAWEEFLEDAVPPTVPLEATLKSSSAGGIETSYVCACCRQSKRTKDSAHSCDNLQSPHLVCAECITEYLYSTKDTRAPYGMMGSYAQPICQIPCFTSLDGQSNCACHFHIHIRLRKLFSDQELEDWVIQEQEVLQMKAKEANKQLLAKEKEKNSRPVILPKDQIRLAMEEAAANARIRSCSKCQQTLAKSRNGCNAMKCQRCQTVCCYVCREVVPAGGYDLHFDMFEDDSGKCPLLTDSETDRRRDEEDIKRDIMELANQVLEEYKTTTSFI